MLKLDLMSELELELGWGLGEVLLLLLIRVISWCKSSVCKGIWTSLNGSIPLGSFSPCDDLSSARVWYPCSGEVAKECQS